MTCIQLAVIIQSALLAILFLKVYELSRKSDQEPEVKKLKYRIELLEAMFHNSSETLDRIRLQLVETKRHIIQRDNNIQANARHLEDLSERIYNLENPNREEEQ